MSNCFNHRRNSVERHREGECGLGCEICYLEDLMVEEDDGVERCVKCGEELVGPELEEMVCDPCFDKIFEANEAKEMGR